MVATPFCYSRVTKISGRDIFRLLLETGEQSIFCAPECDRIIHINPEASANIEVRALPLAASRSTPFDSPALPVSRQSGLVKATEGWMALHINRKISLAVTRQLMHTSVTPNQITWVSMGLGLIGAAFFYRLNVACRSRAHWFLIMTAIGAPIYALLLIGIITREKNNPRVN